MFAISPVASYKPSIKHSKRSNHFNKRFKIYSTAYNNVDPYRETSLRYMGYANELGEAFTSYLPDWGLPASYCVAAAYVMFDTIGPPQRKRDGGWHAPGMFASEGGDVQRSRFSYG